MNRPAGPWVFAVIVLLSGLMAAFIFLGPLARTVSAEIMAPDTLGRNGLGISGPCDFVIFWVAVRMNAAGLAGDLYDYGRTIAWQARHLPAGTVALPWLYPPPDLFLFAWAKRVALFPAFLTWSAGMVLVSSGLLRLAGLPWLVILASCLSPAAILNGSLGQLGLITGTLGLSALGLMPAKPGRAGILAGLLLIKPQTGLFMPIAFLAQRSWRALLAAAFCVLAACFGSAIVFGDEIWRAFLLRGGTITGKILAAPFPCGGTSVLWMLRSFGLGLPASALGQGLATAAAIIIGWRAWRLPAADPLPRLVLTLCLGIIATPYGFLYDLCGCSAGVAALAWRERRVASADILLWSWPWLGLLVCQDVHLELTPVIITLAGYRAARAMEG